MAVTDVFLRTVHAVGRAFRRSHAFDNAAEIAVADDLAMFAEGDDGAVDGLDFLGRDLQAERVAAALHRVAPRMAADDELLRLLADVLRPHDLVRPRVLEDAVLVNARLVC